MYLPNHLQSRYRKVMGWHPTVFMTRARLIRSIALLLLIGLMGTGVLYFFSRPGSVSAAWMDDSWSYRNAVAISSHTAAENNVYISTTLDTSASGQFQSDCGDLRFTNYAGNLLPYYIVSGCTTATTIVHVYFDSFPAGAQTIYYYYGNPSVANGFSAADFAPEAANYVVGSVASQEKSAGPVAYWKFDEGTGSVAYDTSSNQNNGTRQTSTWKDESMCISGKCMYFNGTDEAVYATSNSTLHPDYFSISMWIKPDQYSLNTNVGYILADNYGSNTDWIFYLSDTGKLALRPHVGTDRKGGSTIPLNTWTHVAATYDGSTVNLYVNGKYDGGGSSTGLVHSSSNLTIGGHNTGGWENARFKGYVDEFKVYSYARSAAQIKSDFASKGSGSVKGTAASLGSSAKNSDAFSNGLVGYWKMDEAAANTCTGGVNDSCDSSGNGQDASWGGSPTITSGKFSNSVSLPGGTTTEYISLPNTTLTGLSETTIAMWINATTGGNSDAILSGASSAHGDNAFLFYEQTNLAIYVKGSAWSSGVNLADSTWHYLTVTRNATTGLVQVYLDGSLRNSTTTLPTGAVTIGTNGLVLGQEQDSVGGGFDAAQAFNGKYDDVRIYNRALSGKEVRDLYAWAPGPVGYWNFEEGTGGTVNDTSGNSGTGTWYGTGNHWTQGKFGKSGQFNSTDNYVNVGSGSPLQLSKTGTVCLWFKPLTAFSGSIGAQKHLMGGGPRSFYFSASSSILYYFLSDNATGIGSNASSWDTNWHYVCTTSDGTTLKMYIDGVQQTATVSLGANNYFGNLSAVTIGTGSTSFTGNIDDVKIYNYARTSGQITEDMNAGHPLGGSPVGSQVGYWKFDEGYSTVANNSGSGGSTYNAALASSPNTPTWSNNGKYGKALDFDGSNDYVQVPSVGIASGSFTIEGWVNPKRDEVDGYGTFTGYDGSHRILIATNGQLLTQFGGNFFSTRSLAANTWSHIVYIYNSSENKEYFYINGAYDSVHTPTVTPIWNAAFKIGQYDLVNYKLHGLIDEVKIYNAALTEDEIKLDYNRGSAMILGTLSDTSGLSGGSVASSSAAAAYCIPGDTATCNSPVGEWNFEEKTGGTTNDTSGNNNVGTWAGTGSHWATGKIGTAGNFNGSDDKVTASSSIYAITNALTIQAWIYPTTITGTHDIFSNSTVWDSRIYQSGTNLTMQVSLDDGNTGYHTASGVLTLNTWQHIVGVFDGSTVKIYLNGRQVLSEAAVGTIQTPGSGIVIGSYGSGEYFLGKIDQARIYSYARTPAQVTYDYNRGAPVGHWKLDECQGITANDSSGNGNSGTITIGATGTNTSAGTCTGSAGEAWKDGAVGKYNSSLEFDGTDDWIDIGTGFTDSIESAGSISTWVYRNSNTGGIFARSTGSGWLDERMVLYLRSDINVWGWAISNGSTYQNNPLSFSYFPSGQWVHLVVAWSGTRVKTYVNGKQIDDVAQTVTPEVTGIATWIGKTQGLAGQFFNGQIDDVKIFNYALTPAQIKQVYNEGSSVRFGPATGSP